MSSFAPTSEVVLGACRPELLRRLSAYDTPYTIAPDDPDFGPAFCNYLLLTHGADLLSVRGVVLEPAAQAYERYYWFLRTIRPWQRRHGTDAGMEQQAVQILESASALLDWTLIAQIEALADET